MCTQIFIKRAYDAPSEQDGFRVFVDRLWPRGLSHENFHYDLMDKDIAPSTALREWYHADPAERWPEFKRCYKAELSSNPAFASLKHKIETLPRVTLLYSSRDTEHNNAVVLKEALSES